MLNQLYALGSLIQPGITIARSEAIKRYRALKNCNERILKMICSTQFFEIGKTEKGELFVC